MKQSLSVRCILILLVSAIPAVFIAFRNADDPRITRILAQLEAFTAHTKMQKIYLQTDKVKYMPGETIWLKAYLLDAATLTPDLKSREIFVDLIDRNNKVTESIILKNEDGFARGDISLNDSLPEGNFQIVAYTNWMKNFDESFYFSKNIRIVNPGYSKYITQSSLAGIRQFNRNILSAEKERIIRFFPEGGNVVSDLPCHMAFEAVNKLGDGVNVKGEILDQDDNRVCSFESRHSGMGAFTFTPLAGKRYYARAIFDDNVTEKFGLPEAVTTGYVLMAGTVAGNQIRINIQAKLENPSNEKNEIILVAQSRGEIRYISRIVVKGPVNTSIPKKYFPAGITQLTLFDNQGSPVCERLVFIHPDETEKRTTMDVTGSVAGNDLEYKIRLRDKEGKPVHGNVSLSVTENVKDSVNPGSGHILSNLLLTSDLKGKIKNASEYFNEKNSEARLNLDYVMLVNGWRRFVWKEVLTGQFPRLFFSPSMGVSSDLPTNGVALQPASLSFTEKAIFYPLNEQYDPKTVRKNTRELKSTAPLTPKDPNTVYINNASSYTDMIQYLKGKLAGVAVSDNGIIVRGVNSINSGTDPLILQDNTAIPFSILKTISPKDVASVEVLKGPDASLYGARGANGVLIIHMKTGQETLNDTRMKMSAPTPERVISFYKAREFYVPAYDSWNHKPADYNVPRSVFWKPDIRVDTTGVAVVRFKNRGDVTKLKITVEGIAADGSVLYYGE